MWELPIARTVGVPTTSTVTLIRTHVRQLGYYVDPEDDIYYSGEGFSRGYQDGYNDLYDYGYNSNGPFGYRGMFVANPELAVGALKNRNLMIGLVRSIEDRRPAGRFSLVPKPFRMSTARFPLPHLEAKSAAVNSLRDTIITLPDCPEVL